MNRKLQNTILAFSVTGVMLVMGLMAAKPVLPMQGNLPALAADPAPMMPLATVPVAPDAAERMLAATSAEASRLAAEAITARVEARSRRLEADLAKAESFEQAIATTAGFMAVVATEAAVAGALLGELDAEAVEPVEDTRQRKDSSRKRSGVRSAIAVPYFSFARGTGRGDRS